MGSGLLRNILPGRKSRADEAVIVEATIEHENLEVSSS
jgi:hypothetical protein